jgi:DNA repair protein RadC
MQLRMVDQSRPINAALELGRRLASALSEERPEITNPADVAGLLITEMSVLGQESLQVVVLNTKHKVVGIREAHGGNVKGAPARPALVASRSVLVAHDGGKTVWQ